MRYARFCTIFILFLTNCVGRISSERACGDNFQCQSGECIDFSLECNGDKNCTDGSDEHASCTSPDRTCKTGQFKCRSGQCMPDSWVCDGSMNCPDGEDETFCLIRKWPCAMNFQCQLSGDCIHGYLECDGIRKCRDASDEHASCKSPDRTCKTGLFKCTSGRCIPDEWVCNGRKDCPDKVDEPSSCTSPERTCGMNFQCQSGKCGSRHAECDGLHHSAQCPDGSDEHDSCTSPERACGTNFQCQSGQCITYTAECDGDRNCADGSDEHASCTSPDRTCKTGYFKCAAGTCIQNHLVCSGWSQCPDGSDEPAICIHPDRTCKTGQFKCKGGKCLPDRLLCDGRRDCPDGEDERSKAKCYPEPRWTIVVTTSTKTHAGTDSVVKIQVGGSDGRSSIFRLNTKNFDDFRRGSAIGYNRVMNQIGTPKWIKVWISGKWDSWNLEHIFLKWDEDPKIYRFECYCWMKSYTASYRLLKLK